MEVENAHREYLATVCAYVTTFDDKLIDCLIRSEAGSKFKIDGSCSPGIQKLIVEHKLRYWVMVTHKFGPTTANIEFGTEEFPAVRDEAVIFLSASVAR